MARGNELESLVQQFVSQLQGVISKQVEAEIAGRFDSFRNSIFAGGSVVAARGRPASVPVAAPAGKRRSPLAGREAELKPCPVCGTPNKARRFSYLCEEHRTNENLAKFRGAAKTGAAPAPVAAKKTASKAAKAPKAPKAPGKRGPGRPKGSKNKKSAGKTEASSAQSS